MIDITVSNNQVEVENITYHSFNNKETLVKMIEDIINKAKYSGESMILYVEINEHTKKFINEW